MLSRFRSFSGGERSFFRARFSIVFFLLSVLKNVPSEFFTYLSGLRASSGARTGHSARDKHARRRRAALAEGTGRATMHSRKPIGEGLWRDIFTERWKTLWKIRTKKEGVPLGNPFEEGTKIIPCMPCIQSFSVKLKGILVWELGQTCEAARNGTWKN